MITILFFFMFFIIFGKMIGFALKASWSIFKAVMYLIFCPFILVMLVVGGLIYVAFPLLIVIGIVGILRNA